MKRGDLIRIALQGEYGKPRPAVIIQADAYSSLASITVLPLTSTLRDLPEIRVSIDPNATNGLRRTSEIMIDKAVTVTRIKAGPMMGTLGEADLYRVDRALALFLGFA